MSVEARSASLPDAVGQGSAGREDTENAQSKYICRIQPPELTKNFNVLSKNKDNIFSDNPVIVLKSYNPVYTFILYSNYCDGLNPQGYWKIVSPNPTIEIMGCNIISCRPIALSPIHPFTHNPKLKLTNLLINQFTNSQIPFISQT